jgi:hypothetical protein
MLLPHRCTEHVLVILQWKKYLYRVERSNQDRSQNLTSPKVTAKRDLVVWVTWEELERHELRRIETLLELSKCSSPELVQFRYPPPALLEYCHLYLWPTFRPICSVVQQISKDCSVCRPFKDLQYTDVDRTNSFKGQKNNPVLPSAENLRNCSGLVAQSTNRKNCP